jgi:AraC-like DNA-binding protein
MPSYLELAPPPRLAESVECIWVMRHCEASVVSHRVLPDGCADILFTTGTGNVTLQAVGTMTQFQDVQLRPGQMHVGLRFHPGMWSAGIGTPASLITDQLVSLEDFWGNRARNLQARLEEARSPNACASLLAENVSTISPNTPLQRALAWMRSQNGMVSLDEVASHASLSPRQFRRLCHEQTGLSPKLLARILRFRYAISRVHDERGDHAGLAADCGYFDQSHFISDFQRFSGKTPATFSV